MEENKDQGLNVREKAKAMVALLKDDERLKNERIRALKVKERFAQPTAGLYYRKVLLVVVIIDYPLSLIWCYVQ